MVQITAGWVGLNVNFGLKVRWVSLWLDDLVFLYLWKSWKWVSIFLWQGSLWLCSKYSSLYKITFSNPSCIWTVFCSGTMAPTVASFLPVYIGFHLTVLMLRTLILLGLLSCMIPAWGLQLQHHQIFLGGLLHSKWYLGMCDVIKVTVKWHFSLAFSCMLP